MSKKLFIRVVTLALVASFFAIPHFANAIVNPTTTTSITNTAPGIPTGTAESWLQAYVGTATTDARAESSATYPTNLGTPISFKATVTDPNSDQWYLIICNENGATPGDDAAPTCNSGTTWATSAATASGSEATATYTNAAFVAESNTWYAFACDKVIGGGLCSAFSQGSGASGSPFMVNRRPSFGAMTFSDAADLTIEPGDTIKFKLSNAVIDDPDLNTAQDTVTVYVCSGAADQGGVTTAFDFRANTCTGGTLLCSAADVNPTAADATCNDTQNIVSIPTTGASYPVKIYMEDATSFEDNTGTTIQNYTVQDVNPVLVGYTATDNLAPAAGLSDTVDFSVSLTDNNGDLDVTAVEAFLYDDDTVDLVAGACTLNEKNCYKVVSCTLTGQGAAGSGKTLKGSTNDLGANCTATVWFNANYTAVPNWEVHANPTDTGGLYTGFTPALPGSGVNLSKGAMEAIDIIEGTIAYGTVALGNTSNGQTVTLRNYGNQIIDVLIDGTDMTGSPTGQIAAAQQKWHETLSTFDWNTAGFALVESVSSGGPGSSVGTEANGCSNRSLAIRNVHDFDRCENGTTACTVATQAVDCAGVGGATCSINSVNETMFWKIKIPASQVAGTYTGTNTFAATSDSSCTGTGA